ncbi:MAG TPA: DUF4394 domain-containing protein [Propionibacteriaceae bacterium]
MKMRRAAVSAAVLAAGLLAIPAANASAAPSTDATGLASNGTKLTRFDTDRPDRAYRIGTISGLSGDTSLVGIDRRVQNGKLYGVGNSGGIYTLSTSSAKATKVGQLTIALSGDSFGVDFNPAANALRIISNTGQNLRQPFGTTDGPTVATVADGGLNYLTVSAPGVVAAAYTNNDLNLETATSLFDIDSTLDQVALQSPANSGSLAATGKLGVDVPAEVGFDIFTKLKKGKAVSSKGYITFFNQGHHMLYSVDLLTGAASYEGRQKYSVTDLAVDLW